jgi:hypothetical protein
MRERHWSAVEPRSFVLDGTNNGLITVASTSGIFVKQKVIILSNTQPAKHFEVKRVYSNTEFVVGQAGDINSFSDMTAYTIAESAHMYAKEQSRPSIPDKEYERAVYAEEPIVAKRVLPVDTLGRPYDANNPLPVEFGNVDIATKIEYTNREGIVVINIPLANTEVNFSFPNGTKY